MFDTKLWQKMPLCQQMGNIGSEITRAFYWKNKDKEIAQKTADKALELFDLTIDDQRRKRGLGEILKMRSLFCDCFWELGNFAVSEQNLKDYFIPFAFQFNQKIAY